MKNSSNVIPARRKAQDPSHGVQREACDDRCDVEMLHSSAIRKARAALPTDADLDTVIGLFSLLSNTTRLKLLLALQPRVTGHSRELCVCDLAAVSHSSESMTSHQLRLLREAGLVMYRRAGKLALYRLAGGPQAHLLSDALDYVNGREGVNEPRRRAD